jgi:hypothetical protein
MKARRRSIPLIRVHPDPGAIEYCIQAGHHRTAIETAVRCIEAEFARSLSEHTNDSFLSEVVPNVRNWVIETIYQGAYLRVYHLWEKNCTEYFSAKGVNMKPRGGVAFTEHLKQVLSSKVGLDVSDVMDALNTMRLKVNRMKHQSGVQNDEFICAGDYGAAIATIEGFWEFIAEKERVGA